MRAAWLTMGLCLALLGCDGGTDPGTPESWTSRADEAFSQGDRLSSDPATLPDAVKAWRRAGAAYMNAFRLEDAVPERAPKRALLAFRTGRAWSKAARQTIDPAYAGPHAERALFWLGHARRLGPALFQTDFERAVLLDSDIPQVADKVRAREAYRAYVASCAEAGREVRPADVERLRIAKARLEALTPEGER